VTGGTGGVGDSHVEPGGKLLASTPTERSGEKIRREGENMVKEKDSKKYFHLFKVGTLKP